MDVRLTLSLPRDERYVPLVRGIAEAFLAQATLPRRVIADVTLALTEACANALRHAAGVEEYAVGLKVDDRGCEVEFVDLGPGFDLAVSEVDAEGQEPGRGIPIIRALVDELHFVRDRSEMRVRLLKRWEGHGASSGTPTAATEWLAGAAPSPATAPVERLAGR